MILTRSPFYYNQAHPNDYIQSIDFGVNIGTGSTSSITTRKNYSITKQNPNSSVFTGLPDPGGNTYIDISPYIRDYYEFTPLTLNGTTSPEVIQSPASSLLLVETSASFNDTIGSNEDSVSNTYIATDGYGYYMDGQNYQPTQKILLSHTEYKSDYRGYFIVPLQCDSDDANPTVNSVEVALNFSDSYRHYIKYLVIPCANYTGTIAVAFEGESINIELVEECKYDVNEIQFINRFGVMEVLHTYKAKKESLSFNQENFKNNFTDGVSYTTTKHQLKRYNVSGNKKFTVETGHLNQDYNATIEELMLSEYVWCNGIPVNVSKNSLDLKTRIVDSLITYSLDFEYAYDQLNNV